MSWEGTLRIGLETAVRGVRGVNFHDWRSEGESRGKRHFRRKQKKRGRVGIGLAERLDS